MEGLDQGEKVVQATKLRLNDYYKEVQLISCTTSIILLLLKELHLIFYLKSSSALKFN